MTETAHIANARMSAVAPGAKAAREALFAWAAEEAGVPLQVIDHAYPAPLEALWARLREELCIAGFAAVMLETYDLTLAWAREAEAVGYMGPGQQVDSTSDG